MTATSSDLSDYFAAYAKQTIKNPYSSTDTAQAVSGAPAGAAQATAGKFYINSGDTTCAGLSVSTVVQDTTAAGGTPSYVAYPATPECISVQ
jgi:hypothetical protein